MKKTVKKVEKEVLEQKEPKQFYPEHDPIVAREVPIKTSTTTEEKLEGDK